MTTQRYFLALSNARCGSTFLQTSLVRLPGIATDYELLWDGANPVSEGVPGYAPVITADWNWKPFLGSISTTAPIVGTRVIFTGFNHYSPEDARRLMAGIDPDIAIIHTVRDYFDILKSSRVRDHVTWVSDELLDKTAAEDPSLNATHLWQALRRSGLRDVGEWKNRGRPPQRVSWEYAQRLFVNDVLMAEMARRADRSLRLEFEDIRHVFHEAANFVGSGYSKSVCDAIIRTPVAKRLPPVPDEDLPDWQQLKQLCEILNQAIRNVIEDETPLSEVWTGERIILPAPRPQKGDPGP